MKTTILEAPGNDLISFLSHISYDLKKRRIEYSVIGFFNSDEQPICMIENKGRSSWVECDSKQIIDKALGIKATGLCFIHNHPSSLKEQPNLKPSETDLSFLKGLITSLEGTGLGYLGCWITSNGHLNEILYSLHKNKTTTPYNDFFTDTLFATLLTPNFKNVVESLTKTELLQLNSYRISSVNIDECRIFFNIRRLKYLGIAYEDTWLFYFEARDSNSNEFIFSFSLNSEQAIKAYDAVIELMTVSEQLLSTEIEYTEVTAKLCDDSSCGFYQDYHTQKAFWKIGNNINLFFPITDLNVISNFIVAGLEKIDQIQNQESSISDN